MTSIHFVVNFMCYVIAEAVPMKILECMQQMNAPGVTREKVASHLQVMVCQFYTQNILYRRSQIHQGSRYLQYINILRCVGLWQRTPTKPTTLLSGGMGWSGEGLEFKFKSKSS